MPTHWYSNPIALARWTRVVGEMILNVVAAPMESYSSGGTSAMLADACVDVPYGVSFSDEEGSTACFLCGGPKDLYLWSDRTGSYWRHYATCVDIPTIEMTTYRQVIVRPSICQDCFEPWPMESADDVRTMRAARAKIAYLWPFLRVPSPRS